MSDFIFRTNKLTNVSMGKSTYHMQINLRKARLQGFLFLLLRLSTLSEFLKQEQHKMLYVVFPKILLPV